MMARRDVPVDGTTVTISPLEAPSAGGRHGTLLRVALLDETTGRAPLSRVTARLTHPSTAAASVRVVHEGLIGVAGRTSPAFSPLLATMGRIDLDIEAARFTRRQLSVSFACALRTLSAAASTDVLALDSSAALRAGQRLLISTADGARMEYGTIVALGPGTNEVTLERAVDSPYPAGGRVQPLPADQSLELHREPIVIAGRVLKKTGAKNLPLAAAGVRVSKIWRQLPPAGTIVGPEPPVAGGVPPPPPWDPPIATLWPPSYANIPPSGSLEIEDRPIDGAMSAKALLDDVAAGSVELRLSDGVGLNVNDVIAVDADDEGRREIVEVTSISLAGTANDWSQVSISYPLALNHGRGRLIRRLQPTAPAIVRGLNYAVTPGDEGVLFDTTGIAGSHQVRLVDAGPPAVRSFHRVTVLTAVSDAQGFYRLPPLTRAGKIEISAKDSGSAASNAVEFVPDYDVPENHVDIVVS
jgi:hypothetical protein